MKLLDTNVFVYAFGKEHAYRDPCRAIVRLLADHPERYTIDVECLQELMDVYSRRDQRSRAVALVNDLLQTFSDPIPVTRHEVEEAARLLGVHGRLAPRDAIHAAVVKTNHLDGIVTTDAAFDDVSGLVRFDPAAEPGVASGSS